MKFEDLKFTPHKMAREIKKLPKGKRKQFAELSKMTHATYDISDELTVSVIGGIQNDIYAKGTYEVMVYGDDMSKLSYRYDVPIGGITKEQVVEYITTVTEEYNEIYST